MRIHQPGVLPQLTFRVNAFAVVFIQIVIFNNRNQTIGIGRVGGIACFFQSARPAFIIGDIQSEKKSIAGASSEKIGMVFVGITRMLVGTETFVACIVIMTDCTSPPSTTAFDTEMVVAFSCQLAVSRTTFQQSLRQRDTGGNLMKLHLFNSQITIFIYIFDVTGIPFLCLHSYGKKEYDS